MSFISYPSLDELLFGLLLLSQVPLIAKQLNIVRLQLYIGIQCTSLLHFSNSFLMGSKRQKQVCEGNCQSVTNANFWSMCFATKLMISQLIHDSLRPCYNIVHITIVLHDICNHFNIDPHGKFLISCTLQVKNTRIHMLEYVE